MKSLLYGWKRVPSTREKERVTFSACMTRSGAEVLIHVSRVLYKLGKGGGRILYKECANILPGQAVTELLPFWTNIQCSLLFVHIFLKMWEHFDINVPSFKNVRPF